MISRIPGLANGFFLVFVLTSFNYRYFVLLQFFSDLRLLSLSHSYPILDFVCFTQQYFHFSFVSFHFHLKHFQFFLAHVLD